MHIHNGDKAVTHTSADKSLEEKREASRQVRGKAPGKGSLLIVQYEAGSRWREQLMRSSESLAYYWRVFHAVSMG